MRCQANNPIRGQVLLMACVLLIYLFIHLFIYLFIYGFLLYFRFSHLLLSVSVTLVAQWVKRWRVYLAVGVRFTPKAETSVTLNWVPLQTFTAVHLAVAGDGFDGVFLCCPFSHEMS